MNSTTLTQVFRPYLQRVMALLVVVAMSAPVLAQPKAAKIDATGSPHEVVTAVSDQVLLFLKENGSRLDTDPKGYYADVRALLEPVIAFPYIAKNVMARYWKYATPEQKKQFVNVFTDNLVETYVKGMANYAQFEVSVVPPKKDEVVPGIGKVNVIQLVKNADGDTKVVYNLRRKSAESNWKLVNVWLGSSNLGKSLKSQFAGAVSSGLPKLEKGEKYSKEQVGQAITTAIEGWGKA